MEVPRIAILGDCGTDTTVSKDFQKQTVCNTAVQNMYPGYAVLDGINAVLQLRQHAASQASAVHEVLCLFYGHLGNQGALVLKVTVNTLYIRQ